MLHVLVGSTVAIVVKKLKKTTEHCINVRDSKEKKKTEYFLRVRDAIEEKKISELLHGNLPRREHQSWLETAETIISDKNLSDLAESIEEIDYQLEKSIEHCLVIYVPLKITKKTTSEKDRGEKYRLGKKSSSGSKDKPAKLKEVDLGTKLVQRKEKEANYLINSDYLATESTEAEAEAEQQELIHLAEPKSLYVHGTREKILSDPEIEDENLINLKCAKIEPGPYGSKEEVQHKPAFETSIPPKIEEDQMKPNLKTSTIEEEDSLKRIFKTSDSLEIEEEDQLKSNIKAITPLEIEEENRIWPKIGTSSNFSETWASPDFVTHVPQNVEFSINKGVAKSNSPTTEGQEFARHVETAKRPIRRHISQIFGCTKDDGTATTSPPYGAEESPRPAKNSNRIDQTVNKILDCLKNGGTARRIGIYGSGGIGKTTVLKALFEHAETKKLFSSIIWFTLSRYSSTKKRKIRAAKQLLTWPDDSNTNLESILLALKSENTLLLLDDVWEGIDLGALGIPNTRQDSGCRIILTAKSIDICKMTASDTEFGMELLSVEEAWKLFHDQLGGKFISPDIECHARGIVAECGGLPLTIVVIGRALREESEVLVWKHALEEFLLHGGPGKHGREAIIRQLKLSYDKLESHELKACFLYCALIQEDYKLDELISYFTKEGLLAGNSSERGCNVVKTLLEASLLEVSIDGVSLQMHDLVRDLALAIMSPEVEGCEFLLRSDYRLSKKLEIPRAGSGFRWLPERHKFLLHAGAGLTDPPPKEDWKQAQMIFLMDNQLLSLPENLSCPKLLNLFLERNNNLTDIPMSFFDNMPCLQGLNLSATRIKSLPRSLDQLKRLKELVLRDCERFSTLPCEIGALKQLELLDLRGTQIYKLPDKIGYLVHLKHLLISFYGTNNASEYVKLPQKFVSDGILSKLLLLNVLSITIYPGDKRWSRCVESVAKDVQSLSELVILEFYFPEVKLLDLFVRESPSWNGKGLTKFKLIVGNNVRRIVARVPDEVEFEYNQQDRCFRFVNSEATPTEEVGGVLSRSTAFYLDHHLKIKNLSDFGVTNMNALEFCILRECPEIVTVFDGTRGGSALPVLRHLSIHYLWNLEKIWEDSVQRESLSKLRVLSIHTCPKLTFVLPSTIIENLCNLEVLVVEDCQAVTDVVLYENVNDSCDTVILPKLKKLRLHYLPKLVRIWKGAWHPIENTSFYDCPKLQEKLREEDPELFEILKAYFIETLKNDI
ncbi:hypothetical protein LguiA_002723 [Lonicera macranthoides]